MLSSPLPKITWKTNKRNADCLYFRRVPQSSHNLSSNSKIYQRWKYKAENRIHSFVHQPNLEIRPVKPKLSISMTNAMQSLRFIDDMQLSIDPYVIILLMIPKLKLRSWAGLRKKLFSLWTFSGVIYMANTQLVFYSVNIMDWNKIH